MMAIQQRLYAWVQRLLNVVSDSRTRRINRPSAVIGVETVDRLSLVGRARFDEGFPRGHARDGRFGVRNDLNAHPAATVIDQGPFRVLAVLWVDYAVGSPGLNADQSPSTNETIG